MSEVALGGIGGVLTVLMLPFIAIGIWRVHARRDVTWAEYLSIVAMVLLFPVAMFREGFNRKDGFVWRHRK